MRTLFSGGTIHTCTGEVADWVLVDGDRIAGIGPADDMPAADRVIALDAATLVPGFCDPHVHLPATGLQAAGVDLRGIRSASAVMDALRGRATESTGVLYAGNLESGLDGPLAKEDLDDLVGDRPALVAQADLHSCIVSSALLREVDVAGIEGVERGPDGEPTGRLSERAAAEAWRWFDSNVPAEVLRAAIGSAVKLAYSKGVTSVHEMYVVEWRGWDPFAVLDEVVNSVALDVLFYLATDDVDRVAAMGLKTIGGDWFLDGAFGSHTAWLSEPYGCVMAPGTPKTGLSYRTDEEVYSFFSRAQAAGLQVGVHAIGDAAIEQAINSWEKVARDVGTDVVKALRHRIEHLECASDDHMKRAAKLSLGASVQPAFDRFWGGTDGMYSERIGWPRAAEMNRFRSMTEAGLTLGAGSDSTVTPLDPFLQMLSLRAHNVPGERITPIEALWAATRGGNGLARREDRGSIAVGSRADLAILDRDPLAVADDGLMDTEVLATWCGGRQVWPLDDAEVA